MLATRDLIQFGSETTHGDADETGFDVEGMVVRIRAGEEGSVEELYRAVSKSSRSQLLHRIDPQSVDDHVHEIMLIVLAAIRSGELRDPLRLMSFVRTVTRRRVALSIRQSILSRRRLGCAGAGAEQRAPVHESPEARTAQKETIEGVRRVIVSLDKRDREILIRFYYREQEADQICGEMRLTANQFRLYKSRAIAKCRMLLRRRRGRFGSHCDKEIQPFAELRLYPDEPFAC